MYFYFSLFENFVSPFLVILMLSDHLKKSCELRHQLSHNSGGALKSLFKTHRIMSKCIVIKAKSTLFDLDPPPKKVML